MTHDVVRALGYATLGTRLKRIGEKLQAQTLELAGTEAQRAFPVSHNPALAALDRLGPMSVGDLTKALGQSQPGVTRMINTMKKAGLVAAETTPEDRRVTKVHLTHKGKALVENLKQTLWPATALAVAATCEDLSGTLLEQLTALENALSEQPLSARTTASPMASWEDLYPDTQGT